MRFFGSARQRIVLALILLPWMLASLHVWQFSRDTFIVPLSPDLFDLSFVLLGNHRMVLSPWLVHPLLILYSFLGPALLVVLYLLIARALREIPWGIAIALGLTIYLYPEGAPGTTPHLLLELTFLALCVNPLLIAARPLTLWIFAMLTLSLSNLSEQNEFLIFWSTLSMSLGYLIHYILAQKTVLPKKFRDQFMVTSLTAFGLTCLAISVLFLSMKGAIAHDLIRTTPDRWWLAWTLGLLSVALCWLRPWETHRWLSFAIFGHGIFFSPSLERPIWVVIGWCLLSLVDRIPYRALVSKYSTKKIKPRLVTALWVAPCLCLTGYQIYQFKPHHEFRPSWVSVMKELNSGETDGFLVIGDGGSFLAHFSAARFETDPSALSVENEDELLLKMKENNLTAIIVDGQFVTRFWKRWMKEGGDAEVSNRSIITRLINDGGKEIKLRTLSLEAIQNLGISKLKAYDFYIIRPKGRE